MRFIFPTLALVSLLYAKSTEAKWAPGTTWNYVLGHDIDISKEKAEVVDIDIRKSPQKIQQFHKAGKKVICYFSAGTIEDFRDDFKQYKKVKGLVQNEYDDWPGEYWLDFRVEGIKPLIKNRMKTAISKKCDAIEVDNLDGYQMDEVRRWKKPLTRQDTITFAKWLGSTAHSLGISIGLKNVSGIIGEVGKYYDFAINEECINHDECYLYNNFLKSGKAVFGVTYNGLEKNRKKLCENLNGLGMSMIIKEKTKLVQEGITFNGKKHCGSYFSNAIGEAVKPGTKPKAKKTSAKKASTKKAAPKKATTKKSSANKKVASPSKKAKAASKKVVNKKAKSSSKNNKKVKVVTKKVVRVVKKN